MITRDVSKNRIYSQVGCIIISTRESRARKKKHNCFNDATVTRGARVRGRESDM